MSIGRRQYPFDLIEPKWQAVWDRQQTFRAWNPGENVPAEHPFAQRHQGTLPPKYYVLDMFPYPSGAGLHVGHPEGYTATDILSRYRRAVGYNVLHPMGWDAFGLPAEQYAVKTGQHPRQTTEANIATFKRQIKSLGFSYDWTREVDTTDPKYFKWTQWIFLKLYNSWFNPATNKAEPIETLKYPPRLEIEEDFSHISGPVKQEAFRLLQKSIIERRKQEFRDKRRLAYVTEAPVWWCEQLGTVLANEEVVDGKSEVGGFPVVRKLMRQWMLRITAYAEKLLQDLDAIDWSDSLKEMQRNWIGKSEGAYIRFYLEGHSKPAVKTPDNSTGCDSEVTNLEGIDDFIESATERAKDSFWVFTTRPDTLFGATYMVLAPEHRLVDEITSDEQRAAVKDYKAEVVKKSDLQRTDLAKEKTGVFIGAYAINPVNGERIPIWIADYVLASYGTGAIMAVPAHDEKDFEFAKKFGLSIRRVVVPAEEDIRAIAEKGYRNQAWSQQEDQLWETHLELIYRQNALDVDKPFCSLGISCHSSNEEVSLNGLYSTDAKQKITAWLKEKGLGQKTINYKLRDWLFSRQRYWGEPFPIIWKRDAKGNLYHEALPESALPLLPPKLDDYKPMPDGKPPLARAKDWVNEVPGAERETNTMPQWAGSCWYYLRYLDAGNDKTFCNSDAEKYWMGNPKSEIRNPNEMRVSSPSPRTSKLVALTPSPRPSPPGEGGSMAALVANASRGTEWTPGVDLYVGGTEHAVLHLLYARFWHKVLFDLGYVSTREPFFKLVNQGLILGEDGQKMSKSRGNVVNPDDILVEYGADAFRLYEMFMGPLEMVKPWNTKGVEGVYRFLGRVWRLFVDEASETEFEQNLTAGAQSGPELLEKVRLSAAVRDVEANAAQLKTLHATIKKVTEDLDALRFNTAISALMVFVNEAITWEVKPWSVLRDFLTLLQPFAPHLAEELFAKLNTVRTTGHATLAYVPWPKYDPALLVESTVEIPVQVNGKLRDKLVVPVEMPQSELEALALASEKVKPFMEGKTVKKIIVLPKRLVNIVVG